MIPTRIFFQIHDLRRLLMIYSLNEFLRGHFVSFCIFFLSVQASIFIQNYIDFSTTVSLSHHHSFCYWTLSTSFTVETSGLSALNARKTGGMLPRKKENCNSLDRTQLIHTSILLHFSQRLVIHDSRAEVQRFNTIQYNTIFFI